MAKLRREMNRRMLGNGYCARPVELDCHFESMCESCTDFVTTPEFTPILIRQRDDAAAKGQVGRQRTAQRALLFMAGLFAAMFLGIGFLAGRFGVIADPAEVETVHAQIAHTLV